MPKLMSRPKRFLLALFVCTLLNVSIVGCAQNVFSSQQKGFTVGDNCLFCHSSSGAAGVKDFSPIYANPLSHHVVGVEYFLGTLNRPDFNQPNGNSDGTLFFDENGNGVLDKNDIRLVGKGNAATVECVSCHIEHDDPSGTGKITTNFYLRLPNDGSKLCSVCHRQ